QFDELLVSRIEKRESRTIGLDAQLIGRYSTKAILPRVKAQYESVLADSDCVTKDGLVLYFLRVDPEYGMEQLSKSASFCMDKSLPAAVKMNRWKQIEPAIIGAMNNPELYRARQAAETLALYGSSAAEKAMWTRLRAFHGQWAERENDLTSRPNMPL